MSYAVPMAGTVPPSHEELRSFMRRVAKIEAKTQWLLDFQTALLSDIDLDAALVRNDGVGARTAISAICYRLFGENPPGDLRRAMAGLQIHIR